MDIYREFLLDHYHNPRGWGLQDHGAINIEATNPQCGDRLTIQLDIDDQKISAMQFEGQGCVISVASASILSEYIRDKTTADVGALTIDDMQRLLGAAIQPARFQCALLALNAIQKVLIPEKVISQSL